MKTFCDGKIRIEFNRALKLYAIRELVTEKQWISWPGLFETSERAEDRVRLELRLEENKGGS